MVKPYQPDPSTTFELHRPHLMAVAYRFLGAVSDSEDIVQETYLRWSKIGEDAEIRDVRAYLTRVTARLCLDQLKSARVRRERYVGPWLPEPIVEAAGFSTQPVENLSDDISVALMLALERLSPLERAAFVLHDTFGQTFEEVAVALDRTPAACRKLAARARSNLRAARPRFVVPPGEGERIVEAFIRASQSGDLAVLTGLLTADAVLHSDSGGKVRAARRHILGGDRVARLFSKLAGRHGPARWIAAVRVNGRPGVLMQDAAGVMQTIAFDIRDSAIATLYLVRNPEKLRHVSTTDPAQSR